jgi:nitrate/TMAO reductase-like tetraheme cytochrome c subunit
MSQASKTPNKKKIALVPAVIIAAVVVLVLTGSGFAFAASQESRDPFCASCHTQPETTFYQNSTASQPVDLASFHTPHETQCISCHSGQGIFGRVQAELMGARNALKWYTGTAVQPAVLTFPIGDGNCLKCHQDVTSRGYTPKAQITLPGRGGREGGGEAGSNHWHEFLSRWQASSNTAGSCVSCHSGHAAGSTAANGFMNAQVVETQCEACHQVLRKEGEGGRD